MAMAAAYDGVGEPGEGVRAEKSRRRRRLRLRLERRRVAVGEGRVPVSELVAGDGDVGAMRRCWEGWWREGSHGRGGDRKTRENQNGYYRPLRELWWWLLLP